MRVLGRAGSLLSLLEDAFCTVLDFSSSFQSLNSLQLPPLCAELLLGFQGVLYSLSAAGSCSVLFRVFNEVVI